MIWTFVCHYRDVQVAQNPLSVTSVDNHGKWKNSIVEDIHEVERSNTDSSQNSLDRSEDETNFSTTSNGSADRSENWRSEFDWSAASRSVSEKSSRSSTDENVSSTDSSQRFLLGRHDRSTPGNSGDGGERTSIGSFHGIGDQTAKGQNDELENAERDETAAYAEFETHESTSHHHDEIYEEKIAHKYLDNNDNVKIKPILKHPVLNRDPMDFSKDIIDVDELEDQQNVSKDRYKDVDNLDGCKKTDIIHYRDDKNRTDHSPPHTNSVSEILAISDGNEEPKSAAHGSSNAQFVLSPARPLASIDSPVKCDMVVKSSKKEPTHEIPFKLCPARLNACKNLAKPFVLSPPRLIPPPQSSEVVEVAPKSILGAADPSSKKNLPVVNDPMVRLSNIPASRVTAAEASSSNDRRTSTESVKTYTLGSTPNISLPMASTSKGSASGATSNSAIASTSSKPDMAFALQSARLDFTSASEPPREKIRCDHSKRHLLNLTDFQIKRKLGVQYHIIDSFYDDVCPRRKSISPWLIESIRRRFPESWRDVILALTHSQDATDYIAHRSCKIFESALNDYDDVDDAPLPSRPAPAALGRAPLCADFVNDDLPVLSHPRKRSKSEASAAVGNPTGSTAKRRDTIGSHGDGLHGTHECKAKTDVASKIGALSNSIGVLSDAIGKLAGTTKMAAQTSAAVPSTSAVAGASSAAGTSAAGGTSAAACNSAVAGTYGAAGINAAVACTSDGRPLYETRVFNERLIQIERQQQEVDKYDREVILGRPGAVVALARARALLKQLQNEEAVDQIHGVTHRLPPSHVDPWGPGPRFVNPVPAIVPRLVAGGAQVYHGNGIHPTAANSPLTAASTVSVTPRPTYVPRPHFRTANRKGGHGVVPAPNAVIANRGDDHVAAQVNSQPGDMDANRHETIDEKVTHVVWINEFFQVISSFLCGLIKWVGDVRPFVQYHFSVIVTLFRQGG